MDTNLLDEDYDVRIDQCRVRTVPPPKRRRQRLIPFIPDMYWLLYRRPVYLFVFVPAFTEGLVNMGLSACMCRIIDSIGRDNAEVIIRQTAIFGFVITCVCGVMSFFNCAAWWTIGNSIGIKVKSMLFKSMLDKDVEYFDTHTVGDLLTLLSRDADHIDHAFGFTKSHQVSAIGKLVAAVITMLSVDVKLGLFSLTMSILSLFIIRLARTYADREFWKHMDYCAKVTTTASETVANMRVVSSFNRQKEQVRLVQLDADESNRHDSNSMLAFKLSMNLHMLLHEGTTSVLLNIGTWLVAKGSMSAGQLFLMARASIWCSRELQHIMTTLTDEMRAISSYNRIKEAINAQPSIENKGGKVIDGLTTVSIEFRNVWFKYPTRDAWVLRDVSFTIPHGETAALVGHSGSGKSTIVQLLLRFYDVTHGQILINNIDIREFDTHWLHRTIGVVQQEPILFTMTVKDNISYGSEVDEYTLDDVIRAADIANASNFIQKLPNSYNALLGEKGCNLSGGQKQRIAIARAVIKSPCLLITDEATSALDAKSERKVQLALNQILRDRTSLIIAHRLCTIRSAQKIYVFDQGKLVESGTHDELLARQGAYWELVK